MKAGAVKIVPRAVYMEPVILMPCINPISMAKKEISEINQEFKASYLR